MHGAHSLNFKNSGRIVNADQKSKFTKIKKFILIPQGKHFLPWSSLRKGNGRIILVQPVNTKSLETF
jgi:hypothetical protein